MTNLNKLVDVLKNFELFADTLLKIKTKSGAILPFELNVSQKYLHERLERQKRETGKVRAIILKGRQMGCSTYIQARYFHQAVTSIGKKAFILTHDAQATKNLFEMTKRYYDLVEEGVLPRIDASSAKELKFDVLGSGYEVGTAGNKSVGRSQTLQLFHGSEVAFWPHAAEHAKGVLQAVSDEPGTEVILESTANGIGNYYYNLWKSAESGQSDYQAIFIPWYWQKEYTRKTDGTFALTEKEQELMDLYQENGLTMEHLAWRRIKLGDFSSDLDEAIELMNVEYPMCANDAFRNPVTDRFINASYVNRARTNKVTCDSPLVIGVDPAISDRDKTAIIKRKGRLAFDLETHYNLNTMQIAGLVKSMIERYKPFKVFIDSIGIGAGIVDRLHEMGFREIVEGINVARQANLRDKYRNLRAELWAEMRDWLSQDMEVQIPDSDILLGDLTSLGYKFDSSARLQIESKDDLRARGMNSPDTADALALTFALGNININTTHYQPVFNQNNSGMLI